MRQNKYSIGLEQKSLREICGDHYVNVNVKITKTEVTSNLDNGILKAGTIITADGKVADNTNAFGVLFSDLDFNNSKGTEIGTVLIHGFLNKAKVTKYAGTAPTDEQIAALSMIKFL